MAERDDDEKKPPVDPDRAAILARRQRFIALALTGLSTAACDNGPLRTKPDPCLKSVPRGQEKKAPDEDDSGPPPQPCLSVPIQQPDPQPQPQPDPQPQVCLKIIAPPPDEGGEAGEPAPEPSPQPCLSKPAPKPCLKQAAPKPCLNMVEPS